jgi:hypothetical protein
MNVVANFSKKTYSVEVETETDGGTVKGFATGIYEHGTKAVLTAVPDEDYMFKGWIVNGKNVEGGSDELTLDVDQTLSVRAVFVREFYRQTMTLAKGWNWVSSYLNEPLSLDPLSSYAHRIVGQFNEAISDPELGMVGSLDALTAGKAYKIEANMRFSNTFRGHLYDASVPAVLQKGWNWIGYPSMERSLLSEAITNAEEGDYIVTQTGFSEYADGYWEGTLNMLVPGVGYLYKSGSGKQLAFDLSSGEYHGSRALRSRTSSVTEQDVDIYRYPNTMNITARLFKDGAELMGDGYSIYAMAGEELRGISQYIGRNHYLTVYGDEPVEIHFLVESSMTGDVIGASEKLIFSSDVVGSRKSPFVINMGGTTGIEDLSADGPMTVYSLEGVLVSRNATMKMLRRLPKGVYIVNGQKRFVK